MIDVVCAVIRDGQGRYLACLRPQGKHLGGCWEFPGGKVEPGESPEAALARELLEELAIGVSVGGAFDPVVCHYGETGIRLLPFPCEITAGTPTPLEHDAIRWCAPEDFHLLAWAEADKPVLERIRKENP